MSLDDEPGVVGGDWDFYSLFYGPGDEGVAATSYDGGTDFVQHVFYVGRDGSLWEATKVGQGSLNFTQWAPPAGETLTGHIAAVTVVVSSVRYVFVAATTTGGDLYVWGRDVTSQTAYWNDHGGTLTWSTTEPLAGSAANDDISFFGTHTTDGTAELGLVQYNNFWSAYDLGAPSGYEVCGAIAAAQGPITATTYRFYLICTPTPGSSPRFFLAYGTSSSDTTFAWIETPISGVTISDDPNIVAAAYRDVVSQDAEGAIDLFALANNTAGGQQLFRRTRDSGGLQSLVELDAFKETSPYPDNGALTAGGTNLGYSRARFVDPARGYLIERLGTDDGDADSIDEMQNFGHGGGPEVAFSSGDHAEGMLAEHGKYLSIAMINRPGPGDFDWPRIHVVRSEDDGQTFGPVEVMSNTVAGKSYEYVTDPSTAVTSSGRTYVLQFAQHYDKCEYDPTRYRAAVWLTYADPGDSTWSTILVREQTVVGGDTLDHPFMSIDHGSLFTPDRLHIAWWNTAQETMEYSYYDDGNAAASTPVVLLSGDTLVGPPRVTGNDRGYVVIYHTPLHFASSRISFCHLNSTLDGCFGGWQDLPYNRNSGNTFLASSLPGTPFIRSYVGFSMAVSPTVDGILYACFKVTEADGSDTDVVCTRGIADVNGAYTWSPLVFIGPQNDDKDQFNPEVSVIEPTYELAEGVPNEGQVYVQYYELNADELTYDTYMTTSADGAASFYPADRITSQSSDADYLPRHCQHPNDDVRFIGDFAAVQGSPLHTHGFYVEAQAPNIETTVSLQFQSLGNWSGN